MMQCNRQGCAHTAGLQVGIRAYAADFIPSDDTRIEMFFSLAVCQECARKLKVEDVLTTEGKRLIQAKLREAGKAPLDLKNAQLVFRRLGQNG